MLQALGDALFQKVSARWHARARALPRLLECNARVQVYAFVRRSGDSGDDEECDEERLGDGEGLGD